MYIMFKEIERSGNRIEITFEATLTNKEIKAFDRLGKIAGETVYPNWGAKKDETSRYKKIRFEYDISEFLGKSENEIRSEIRERLIIIRKEYRKLINKYYEVLYKMEAIKSRLMLLDIFSKKEYDGI